MQVLIEIIWFLICFNVQKIGVIKPCAFEDCDIMEVNLDAGVLIREVDRGVEFI